MRRCRAYLGVVLLLVPVVGCTTTETQTHTASFAERLHGFDPSKTPNLVQLDVALVERPIGDTYLSTEVWGFTDQQTVDPERKSILEDNGFRVGHVVGQVPSGLQTLLTLERCCLNPRRRFLASGKALSVLLGPTMAECSYQVRAQKDVQTVELPQAQCALTVKPTLTRDGKIKLHFTPRVEHGQSAPDFRVASDHSGLVLVSERPCHAYPQLSWETVVAPGDYLLIGGKLEQPSSLGYHSFVQEKARLPVQRVLVLRANRNDTGLDTSIPLPPGSTAADLPTAPVSLAYQATLTAARAKR